MSTLAHPDTSTSLSHHVNNLSVDDRLPQHMARIPRSVLGENDDVGLTDNVSHVSSVVDTDSHRSLRMAVALTSQRSSSLVSAHESKAISFIAHTKLSY